MLAQQSRLELIDLKTINDPTYTAFNEILFRTSIAVDELMPKTWGIHLVGVMKKTDYLQS